MTPAAALVSVSADAELFSNMENAVGLRQNKLICEKTKSFPFRGKAFGQLAPCSVQVVLK